MTAEKRLPWLALPYTAMEHLFKAPIWTGPPLAGSDPCILCAYFLEAGK